MIEWFVIPNLLVTAILTYMVWRDGYKLREFTIKQAGIFGFITIVWPIGAGLIACQVVDSFWERKQ